MMLCVHVVVVVMLLAVQQAYCQSNIRLANGPSRERGRVEVLVNGKWGTVCDDSFDLQDANVICRMLGFPRALVARNRGYYGYGTGKIWIDQLNCSGSENSIFDCGMNEFGNHDCEHREDAGVECYRELPKRPSSMPIRLICPYNGSCNNKAIKRGPDTNECEPSVHVEGIVEVYYNNSWQLVSADGWDDADVNVVCGQLGYSLGFGTVPKIKNILNNSTKVKRRERRQFNEKTSTVLMKEVECTGTERHLRLCSHFGWGPFENQKGKVATARCGFKPHVSCNNEAKRQVRPAYRLRSGVMPWQGRVEVLYSNVWGTVCDIGFNYHSCNVLCRSLGYGTCKSILTRASYGRGIGKVWMNEVKCTGTEQYLHECNRLPWGNARNCGEHAGDVGVECHVPDVYDRQPEIAKFVPVNDDRNSRVLNNFVEVTDSGVNGLLCYDDVDTKTLEVLCRSSSPPQFLMAHRSNTHSQYTGQRYKGNFICNGDELNIRECRPSFHHVTKCDTGDLVVYCDTGRPDLVPVLDNLQSSLSSYPYVDHTPMFYLRCALEDGCLASDAANAANGDLRHLLRFDSLTMNYGRREFSPFLDRSQWIWHQCHNHYHSFEVFVAYDLLSLDGRTKIAEGHKASFCLEDSICESGTSAQHRCGTGVQGISVNCGDLYARHLDCQWIDITGVPDGIYIIRLHVNPDKLVVESDYRNNIIECSIRLFGRIVSVFSCRQSDHS